MVVAIKAVLVDMDDVLYDGSAWDRWLAQIFGRLPSRTLEADFAQSWRETFLPVVHRGQQEFHAALACCLKEIGLAASHVDEIVAASLRSAAVPKATFARFRPCAARWLACNRPASTGPCWRIRIVQAQSLRQKLDRISLNGLFDHVLSTADLGASLSDESCYARALETLHHSAGEVLFVGHCPRDLHAAEGAGLRTVGFNIRHVACTAKCIDRFEDLLALAIPGGPAAKATVCRLKCAC